MMDDFYVIQTTVKLEEVEDNASEVKSTLDFMDQTINSHIGPEDMYIPVTEVIVHTYLH